MARARRPGRPVLTKKEVAKLLACSERTVERLVEDGKLSPPRHLIKNAPRWFPADVRVYLYRLRRGDFG